MQWLEFWDAVQWLDACLVARFQASNRIFVKWLDFCLVVFILERINIFSDGHFSYNWASLLNAPRLGERWWALLRRFYITVSWEED